MINQQDLMANLDRSRTMSQAKTMLDQNIPIEVISQQLGLDRNTLNNLLMQNQLMPDTVMQPQDYRSSYGGTGIMNNPIQDKDTKSVIDGIVSGSDESQDIIEFLGIDLGADLNEGEDTTQTVGQALNSGSVAGALNNQDSFLSFLQNSSSLENLADPEKLEIYKQAAANIIGEPDYDSLITQPDKVMPYLAAGLSLIKSGEADEDWGSALGKAFITGYGSKKAEDKAFKKSKLALELDRNNQINSVVTNLALTDVKDRIAFNNEMKKIKYKNDTTMKRYDIMGSEGFKDKETKFMSNTQRDQYEKLFPGSIREAEDYPIEPYSVYTDDGSIMNVFMDQDQLRWYQENGYAGQLRKGHEDKMNTELYMVYDGTFDEDGTFTGEKIEKSLTKSEAQKIRDETGQRVEGMPTGGNQVYVRNKNTNKTQMVSQAELMRNSALYDKISSFSGTFTSPDGTTMEFGNGINGSRAIETQGIKQFDFVRNKIQGIDRAVDNYYVSADNLDGIVNDFISQYPDQANIPFNNLAGSFADFAENIVITVDGFKDIFSLPSEDGGYSFRVGASENNIQGVAADFEQYRTSVMDSKEFEQFKESPLAKFLEANGVTDARLDAALFDLAMLGAGAYNTEKGLDLRAISDFETKQFMQLQGANAKTFNQFKAITRDFRSKLVNRSIGELERSTQRIMLDDIRDRDNNLLEDKITLIQDTADGYLKKLQKRKDALDNSIPEPDIVPGANVYTNDTSVDPDNKNVVLFPTINITPDSNFGQRLGITEPISTETKLQLNDGEFSYRDILNKYSALISDPAKQQSYYQLLQKELEPTQFQILNIHLIQAGLIERQ